MILPEKNSIDLSTQHALDILNGIPCNSAAHYKNILAYSFALATDKKVIQQAGVILYPEFGAGMYPELFAEQLQLTPENSCQHIIKQLRTNDKIINEMIKLWEATKPVGSVYDLVLEAAEGCEPDQQAKLYLHVLKQRDLSSDQKNLILNLASKRYTNWSYAQQIECLSHLLTSREYSHELCLWAWDTALNLSLQQPAVNIEIISPLFDFLNIIIGEEDEEKISKLFQKPYHINPDLTARDTLRLINNLEKLIAEPKLHVIKAKIGLGVLCGYLNYFEKHPKINDLRFTPDLLQLFFACFENNYIGGNQGFSILKKINEHLEIDLTATSTFDLRRIAHTPKPTRINQDYETKLQFHWRLDPPKTKSYESKESHIVESLFKIKEVPPGRYPIIKTILSAGRFFQNESDSVKLQLKQKAIKFFFKLVPNAHISESELTDYANQLVGLFGLNISQDASFISKMLHKISNEREFLHQPIAVGIKVRAAIILWKAMAAKINSKELITPMLYELAESQKCPLNAAFGFYEPISELELSQRLFNGIERLMNSDEFSIFHKINLAYILLKSENPPFELIHKLLDLLTALMYVDLDLFIPFLRDLEPHCKRNPQFCSAIEPLIYKILTKKINPTIETEKEYMRNFYHSDLEFIEVIPGNYSISRVIDVFFKNRPQIETVFLRAQIEALVFIDHIQQLIRKLDILSTDEILGYYAFYKQVYQRLAENEHLAYINYFDKVVSKLEHPSMSTPIDHESITEAWNRLTEYIENRHNRLLEIEQVMFD